MDLSQVPTDSSFFHPGESGLVRSPEFRKVAARSSTVDGICRFHRRVSMKTLAWIYSLTAASIEIGKRVGTPVVA